MKDGKMQTYETADLYLGAYLHSSGIELVGLHHEGKKGIFVFGDAARCRELVLEYLNGRARCDAREFGRMVRELKSLVVNTWNGG